MTAGQFPIIEILLVEDNPGDVILVQEALQEGKVRHKLHIAVDGIEALEFLRKQHPHSQALRPDFILLDLNLPRKNGREVLADIKSDPQLHTIPVVILTSSAAEEDILNSYTLHANSYITKPVNFEQFINIVASIENFWFEIVKLPPKREVRSK
jgi:two-component system, chemotaxis family, response regulator Rcp1